MSTAAGPRGVLPPELTTLWRELGLWTDGSLGTRMAAMAAARPDVLLHIHGPERAVEATLGEVHAAGRRLAGSLHALGLRAGDTLAMQLPNCIENAVVFQAAAVLGCVMLPVGPSFGSAELAYVLRDSRAKALIVKHRWRATNFLERIAKLPELPDLAHRIVLGDEAPAGTIAWADLPEAPCPASFADPDATALLLYTSGTTASPKGVRHSARSLLAELNAQRRLRPFDGAQFGPWPPGHIAGTNSIFGHAVLGREMIILESWDPAAAAMLIERYGVEQTSGTPFHLAGLMEAAARDGRDLSSLKEYMIGATTVPPAVVEASEAVGIRCVRAYGSTEIPTLTQCLPSDPRDKRLSSDGRPNPGCQVRVVDDDGNDVPVGIDGEIVGRAAEMFQGYSDRALDARSYLPGGWFLTGDIGRFDAEGFLTITDRKKDIIIRGGENISSLEVEGILLTVPGVREAAAVGWPDPRLGERVCAVLVVEGDRRPAIGDLQKAFQAQGVARHKTPERIEFVAELPRTPSGKVQKAELRRALFGTSAAREIA